MCFQFVLFFLKIFWKMFFLCRYFLKYLSFLIRFPIDFISFLSRLISFSSIKFILIVFVVYGITQGFCEGWFHLFQRYFFKDSLLLSPGHAQLMTAVTRTPWNIKVSFSHSLTFFLSFSSLLSDLLSDLHPLTHSLISY